MYSLVHIQWSCIHSDYIYRGGSESPKPGASNNLVPRVFFYEVGVFTDLFTFRTTLGGIKNILLKSPETISTTYCPEKGIFDIFDLLMSFSFRFPYLIFRMCSWTERSFHFIFAGKAAPNEPVREKDSLMDSWYKIFLYADFSAIPGWVNILLIPSKHLNWVRQ